jgi:hypothetical protein
VSKALHDGRAVATPRGGIDLRNKVNAAYLAEHAGRPSRAEHSTARAAAGGAKSNAIGLNAQRIQADIDLKREQTATHRQRRLERLGLLVEKALVDKRLATLGGEVRTRFLDLPARVFPQLIALVKSGREDEALTHLEHEIGDAIERVKEKATA